MKVAKHPPLFFTITRSTNKILHWQNENLLTLISTQRGLNKTSKINGDGSGSMKGIHWGIIGASGCGKLLLLEWDFVKLAKQYCINETGKMPYDCMLMTQTTETI